MTTALIATGAYANTATTSADAVTDTDSEVVTSRGDNAMRSYDVFVDDAGYLIDTEGYYYVDMEGNAIQPNVTQRRMGADDTAMVGVDDDGLITTSRGNDAMRAHEAFVDDEGYMRDVDGRYYVDMAGNTITIDPDSRKMGADDTALMGVDGQGNIAASRGNDAERATDTVGGSDDGILD